MAKKKKKELFKKSFNGKSYTYVETLHIQNEARKIKATKNELKKKGYSIRTYKMYGKWDDMVDIYKRKLKKKTKKKPAKKSTGIFQPKKPPPKYIH